MKTGIKIKGGDVDRQAVESVADAITKVFDSGSKNNMDQETIRAGIGIIAQMGVVNNTSITGSQMGDRYE